MSTTTRHNDDLFSMVSEELNWDTGVSAERIQVNLLGGVATLTGSVDSFAGKVAAQKATHRVSGARDVANDIEVRPTGSRSDTEIAQAIRHTLEWHRAVAHESIETTVSDGFGILPGDAYFLSQRAEAEQAVRDTVGVRGVTNLIQVEPKAAVMDQVCNAAREAIRAALERKAGRAADHITVATLPGGAVSVAGEVRTWAERRAILGAAGYTPGVAGVQDFLTVNPFPL